MGGAVPFIYTVGTPGIGMFWQANGAVPTCGAPPPDYPNAKAKRFCPCAIPSSESAGDGGVRFSGGRVDGSVMTISFAPALYLSISGLVAVNLAIVALLVAVVR